MRIFKTGYESGRSMVEMLGVLAIIGVLSVGGVMGYSMAMRKYRANEIVQMASMLIALAGSSNSGEGKCLTLSESNLPTTVGGVSVNIKADTNPSPVVSIQIVDGEWEKLCDIIESAISGNDIFFIRQKI